MLSQGFFDNFTSDFLAPTLNELTRLKFSDIVNQQISIEGLTTDFNVTGISVIKAELDGTVPIVKIGDGQLRFELVDFTFDLSFDYEFITNPPIFADIGTATVNIGGMTLTTDIETFL